MTSKKSARLRASIVVLLAASAALVPIPADLVERFYSRGVYPSLQALVTSVTNLVPIALLDPLIVIGLIAGAGLVAARIRQHGWMAGLVRAGGVLAVSAAVLYLVFLGMWGLNYRRVPLESKIAYDGARVNGAAARAFAIEAVAQVNARRRSAVEAPFDERALADAFAQTQRILGASRLAVTGRPKQSLLMLYFRQAAIDGMTDPFFLEIILNPDLLEAERPFVLAHEWAHLAGYADESEANFVAWLTCVRGDPMARYSAWLAAYGHASSALTREERRQLPALDEGPRADLRAMAERYQRSSKVVRAAARDAYDSYLRANRIEEGIESYNAVLKLMLGTAFAPGWTPRLRADVR